MNSFSGILLISYSTFYLRDCVSRLSKILSNTSQYLLISTTVFSNTKISLIRAWCSQAKTRAILFAIFVSIAYLWEEKMIVMFSCQLNSIYLTRAYTNSLNMYVYKSLFFSFRIFIVTLSKVRNSGIFSNEVSKNRICSFSCFTNLTCALSSINF